MIRKRGIIRMVVVTGLIFAIVVGPGLFSDDLTRRETSLLMAPIFVLIVTFSTMTSLKKQKEQFLSFVLTIDKDVVIREQLNMPTVALRTSDITSILRSKAGGLTIIGLSHANKIAIPADMENYDQLIAMLGDFKPITEAKRDYAALSWLITLAAITLLAIDFLVRDRMINIISYSLTIILLAWSLVATQRNPLLDRRTKGLAWVVLIPLLSFAYTLYILIKGT